MRWVFGPLSFCIIAVAAGNAYGEARKDLIEVSVGGKKFQGKVVAHDDRDFWLLARDGRLRNWPIRSVGAFREVSKFFRGKKAAEIRDRLRKEFGREYEVAGTTYHLVVAPKGRGRMYAKLFDSVYRQFSSYCSTRGFHLKRPPFPMVAIVFAGQREFSDYAQRDGVRLSYGILGYYHRRTNRVALYESRGSALPPIGAIKRSGFTGRRYIGAGSRFVGQPSSAVANVIIHEATHQAAFNTGLHSRIGTTPKWVVEGLAMVFEAPGIRNRTGKRGAKSRINAGRYRDFKRYNLRSRKGRTLADFVSSDRSFGRATTAYAEAWALSFFLIERKSQNYSRYLKILTERDPLKPYPSSARIADFQKAFGSDLDRLEVEYLRFIKSLN